jgi:hypothetical protein
MFGKIFAAFALLLVSAFLAAPADAQSTCKPTSAAPTYAQNVNAPLSCDLSGNLRTSGGGGGGGGTSSTYGAAFPATGTAAGFTDGTNMVPGKVVAGQLQTIAGGYEFQAGAVPTVTAAAYAAGQSLGGLMTISIGSTNGLSGILTGISVSSKGGSTAALAIYAWSKNPAATTCTDRTNFVSSQTDNQFLIVTPQAVSPALAVTAQDIMTYGAAQGLVGKCWCWKNR